MSNYLTPEQHQSIVVCYQQGNSLDKTVKITGFSRSGIWKILKRFNIPRRQRYSSAIDESFFDVVDTPQKAYVLGWLYTDGCNHEKRRTIHLAIQAGDRDVLEKMRIYMKHERKIYIFHNQKSTSFSKKPHSSAIWGICSPRLSQVLSKLGCMARKTKILQFPTLDQVPRSLHRHFIRGAVEGDGWFYKDKRGDFSFSLVGNRPFVQGVATAIEEGAGVVCNIYRVREDWFARVTKSGRGSVVKILDWLYVDCEDMFLQRKYDIYRSIKDDYQKRPSLTRSRYSKYRISSTETRLS